MPTWTTDRPGVPGVYWWRAGPGRPAHVCEVWPMGVTDAHMCGVPPGTSGMYRAGVDGPIVTVDAGGEWWGPVPPPGEGD